MSLILVSPILVNKNVLLHDPTTSQWPMAQWQDLMAHVFSPNVKTHFFHVGWSFCYISSGKYFPPAILGISQVNNFYFNQGVFITFSIFCLYVCMISNLDIFQAKSGFSKYGDIFHMLMSMFQAGTIMQLSIFYSV